MKALDMIEVVPQIDEKNYEEGSFTHEYILPDNRSAEVSGFIEVFGRMVRDPFLVNDPYFEGTCEVTIIDVKAYDSDGTLIEAINVKEFERKLNNYLNRD